MNAHKLIGAIRRISPSSAIIGVLSILVLLFTGLTLFPNDGLALAGNDVRGQYWPWMTTLQQGIRTGHLLLWDPYQFSGFPTFSDPQIGYYYPPAWLVAVLPVNVAISFYVALHLWLAGTGMVLLTRKLGASWFGAALAALTFTFSGYFSARLEVGHIGLVATGAWTPWILLAYSWSVDRGDIWAGLAAGLPFGLAIMTGNPTMLLYVSLIWLAHVIFDGLTGKGWLRAGRQFALAGTVGLLLSAAQLIPLAEFATQSTRTGGTLQEWGTLWSLPPFHLITLLIPGYFGDPVQAGYWSVPDFAELTYYVGALPLLAVPLALRIPTRRTWLYVGLAIFGLLTALGTYGFLYPILYQLIPLFRVVRVPARAAFMFVFAASALLAEVVTEWDRIPTEARLSALKALMPKALIVIAGIGILGLAGTGAAFAAFHPSDTGGRLWHQAGGWLWAMLIFLTGGGLLWRYSAQPEDSGRKRMLALGLTVLAMVDLWVFGYKLIELQPAVVDPLWLQARNVVGGTPQRVVPWATNLYIQNDAALVEMNSVLGYNPLEIRAYYDFAIGVGDPRSTAYDILGVEYVISPSPLEDVFLTGDRPLTLVTNTGSIWVYHRSRVLPIARIAYDARVVDGPQDAISRVYEPGFDPTTTVILSQFPPCDVQQGTGTAAIAEHRAEYWRIETDSDAPGILVLSETAYPGWHVTVDGQPASSLTAYSVIRAVCVPEGRHIVEWVFDPVSRKIGIGVSLIALAVLTGAGIMVWRHKPVSSSPTS